MDRPGFQANDVVIILSNYINHASYMSQSNDVSIKSLIYHNCGEKESSQFCEFTGIIN